LAAKFSSTGRTTNPYDPVTTERAKSVRDEMALAGLGRGTFRRVVTKILGRSKEKAKGHHTPTPPSIVQGGEDIV